MADRQQVVQQPPPQLDIRQIVRDAQSRWLRPAEISEVLYRYLEVPLKTSPAPPYQPPSGSLFLFDRKALRYFRKDGHNWRKKKDGKTVKEAHERLKVGSVNALHCYYAHGEDNANFQRRSYWLLEGTHEHLVLVHYLEALQGNRSSVFRLHDHSLERQFYQLSAKQQTRSPEVNGASATTEADDEEADEQVIGVIRRPVSLMDQLSEPPGDSSPGASQTTIMSPVKQEKKLGVTNSDINDLLGISDFQDVNTGDVNSLNLDDFLETVQHENLGDMGTWEEMLEHSRREETSGKYLDSLTQTPPEAEDKVWQTANETMNQSQPAHSLASFVGDSQQQNHLEALGSFGRWIAEEIRAPACSPGSDSDAFLSSTFEERLEHDTALSYAENMPSVHIADQKFRIVDYSPEWGYAYEETKVLVSGEYLVNAYQHKWCCMFGETEVEGDILPTGVIRCRVPPHPPGRVPFYITCSNRMACSEVRDFEFRSKEVSSATTTPTDSVHTPAEAEELLLRLKLVRMLCSDETSTSSKHAVSDAVSNKVRSFFRKVPEDCEAIVRAISSGSSSSSEIKDRIFDVFVQMKLQEWLLRHAGPDGKGPCVFDKEGQGLLHVVSAAGMEWAIAPILAAGVVVNFRDVHGWTALHWASYYGRENVILSLLAAKAVPELLTDPTAAHPNGQTPADIASSRGHTGIAGYLAEAALQHHLSVLTLKDGNLNEIHYTNASLAGENAASILLGRFQALEDESLMKQSLTAVRRSTQAAALIQSAFREFSFRRKQEMEEAALLERISSDNVEFVMAAKKIQNAYRGHQSTKRNVAATKIQSKFRGWKGRHEYLVTRQRIIKIQAHVRGYQARKQYRKIIWSVGVLEKVILRWHRGRHGLRGFQAEDKMVENEAEDDFLSEARKQKERVIESSVERVQAMVRSPEARAQYARMRAASEQNQIKLDYEVLENYIT